MSLSNRNIDVKENVTIETEKHAGIVESRFYILSRFFTSKNFLVSLQSSIPPHYKLFIIQNHAVLIHSLETFYKIYILQKKQKNIYCRSYNDYLIDNLLILVMI
ncbi:hypothetical protein EDEG_02419 [Edhazardia aedis USNM 41457]|uniref:Uncharacterized protein n=1 Tax=Edhazardia aedis (strain USNM 41457) TaxID=1003232 RepID=J9D6Q9_EDHAE|nr:hypothetical protein EDEG_02419 [Edhazardia aedis USNM 41457]|eukprot:EJW03204.1 hypothetical protein EDEG_02419 [Edhazardia aedis USNM 41457]